MRLLTSCYESSYRWRASTWKINSLSKQGIWVIWVPVNRVKLTGKWGKIQRKLELIGVSWEIRLSIFELSGLYCIVVFYPCRWFTWSWHLRWYSSCCWWCCSSSGNGICKSQVNPWMSLVYYHCYKPKKIELDFSKEYMHQIRGNE